MNNRARYYFLYQNQKKMFESKNKDNKLYISCHFSFAVSMFVECLIRHMFLTCHLKFLNKTFNKIRLDHMYLRACEMPGVHLRVMINHFEMS